MIQYKKTCYISAALQDVWDALTIPKKVLLWDKNIIQFYDNSKMYPLVGHDYHWQYSLGPFKLKLYDYLTKVEKLKFFSMEGRMLFFKWSENFSLKNTDQGVQITLEISTRSHIPLIRNIIEKIFWKAIIKQQTDDLLLQLKHYCERNSR